MEKNLPASQPPTVRIGSPAAILAVVPHLLGFMPARSLVVVGAGPPRRRVHVAFRYDLPDPPDAALGKEIAAHALAVLARQRLTVGIVLGYGPAALVTPLARAVGAGLRRGGIELKEMLRVEDGRYWSYVCGNPACCPAEGVPFEVSAHPAATALAADGKQVLGDRAALAATLAPLGGLAAESMRQATERAEQRAAEELTPPGEGLGAVGDAIGTYRGGGRITGDDRIAWLSVALADLRVRDDAWARMEPEHRDAHCRLWTDVVRRARLPYVPAPAALLAFSAWQAGDGALANVAIERALDADPGYSMALLLRDAIEAGVPPSAARLPMTPEEVAASYARKTRKTYTP
jgi:hypothetical protein